MHENGVAHTAQHNATATIKQKGRALFDNAIRATDVRLAGAFFCFEML